MYYSYDGLDRILSAKGMTKTALAAQLGISSRTIAKMAKGEKIADYVLKRIAEALSCSPAELCKEKSDNLILQTLRDEKHAKVSGGLYHELQVRMTYNSNHIEGSQLSEDQTRQIFETQTIRAGDGIPVDDIIETVNHFRAIDYVIDNAEDELTEDIIKELHRILKQGTADTSLSWFAVGDYKKRANVVDVRETVKPKDVPARMKALLFSYHSAENITVNDIIAFHRDFESIHPFQDGNGRVGRLIALKECLHYGIVPFIIEDAKKVFYYRGLAEWENEKGYLIDTCLDGQDTFKRLLALFDIDSMMLHSLEQYKQMKNEIERKLDEADAVAANNPVRYSHEAVFGQKPKKALQEEK